MEKLEDSPEAEVGDLFVTKFVDGVCEGRIRMWCPFGLRNFLLTLWTRLKNIMKY